jgi:hypothetical protein
VRKVLLVLSALVMVLSGVAMVSAYEAHTINVEATVERAMDVDVTRLHYGTVFPEEWFSHKQFMVGTSGSFCQGTQTRVINIDYEFWKEWKRKSATEWYPWLGDALYLAQQPTDTNGDGKINLADSVTWYHIGDPPSPTPGPGASKVAGPFTLTKPSASAGDHHFWTLGFDVPVFEDYYNKWTDVPVKPSGLDAPTVVIDRQDDPDRWHPDGVELGVHIKIQVTDVY